MRKSGSLVFIGRVAGTSIVRVSLGKRVLAGQGSLSHEKSSLAAYCVDSSKSKTSGQNKDVLLLLEYRDDRRG